MYKITIVEDDDIISNILNLMLKSFKKQSDIYDNPVMALEAFKNDNNYDAIISDLDMPQMDGIDFIKQIRKYDKNIPIILCSGYIDEYTHQLKDYLNIGAIFNKPLEVKELNNILNKLILNNQK